MNVADLIHLLQDVDLDADVVMGGDLRLVDYVEVVTGPVNGKPADPHLYPYVLLHPEY